MTKAYRKLFAFAVLHTGWELDATAWVAELDNGQRVLVMSNHGNEYIAQPQELLEKIAEYENCIADSKRALDMLS